MNYNLYANIYQAIMLELDGLFSDSRLPAVKAMEEITYAHHIAITAPTSSDTEAMYDLEVTEYAVWDELLSCEPEWVPAEAAMDLLEMDAWDAERFSSATKDYERINNQ